MSTGDPLDPVIDVDPWVPPPPIAPPPGRRPRGPVLVVVAVLAVLALVGSGAVVLVARGTSDHGRPAAEGAPARDLAIRAILHRRAAAVLHRDERAFLSDVDPSATAFLDAQRTLFENLRQVQFASWRYEVLDRADNRPDLSSTYDVPFYLPNLLLHYAIAGYDAGPVARAQIFTFVLRGGRWRIGADSDADNQLPPGGHADAWDRREIVVGHGKHALLLADAQDKARLTALVGTADRAVARVAGMWPTGWRRKVVVVAVRDPALIDTYFRTDLQSVDDVAAISNPDTDLVPGWTPQNDTPYDGTERAQPRTRIIINPRYFNPKDPANLDLLAHEVTHAATQAITGAGAPAWLVEGTAEYTAYRYLRPFSLRLLPKVKAQVRQGSLDLPTYDYYNRDIDEHYQEAFIACDYLAERYGEDMLRRVYARLGPLRQEQYADARTRRVVHDLLGISTTQLQADIAAYAGRVAS
jgi:hypothetical protein